MPALLVMLAAVTAIEAFARPDHVSAVVARAVLAAAYATDIALVMGYPLDVFANT